MPARLQGAKPGRLLRRLAAVGSVTAFLTTAGAATGPVLRAWVLPSIGHIEVSRLTPGNVEAMQASMAARGLSPASIARARRVTVTLLADAERDGIILRNPARMARPPRAAEAPIRALPPESIGRLGDVARADGTIGSLVLLAIATGLRRGAAGALLGRRDAR